MSTWRRLRSGWRGHADKALLYGGVPFFLVACLFTYYGSLNRTPSGDTYGTVYTAVALVQRHTIWLDHYLPIFQMHSGQHPYMLAYRPDGHIVNLTPTASSALAVPAVALFDLAGAKAQDWGTWMEAGMLTAALATAASAAVLFVLFTRLTSRRRAALVAATYAWATLAWSISGQALWQHGGATLALAVALLALVDRRLTLAGAAVSAMIAFRLSTPVIALFLLPLIGRRPADWGRFLLGIAPFAIPLAAYNWLAFGSPLRQGYGTAHITDALKLKSSRLQEGLPGLLVSPGRGLIFYSPILLFAIVGAIRGRRTPLYFWCALAAAAYVVVAANEDQWWGGQSFGPRRLTDALPLFAVLLVPAIGAIARTRWIWAYVVLLAYSVFVELIAAAANPTSAWFDKNPDVKDFSTWWRWTNNELITLVQTRDFAFRLTESIGLLALSLVIGALTSVTVAALRHPAPP